MAPPGLLGMKNAGYTVVQANKRKGQLGGAKYEVAEVYKKPSTDISSDDSKLYRVTERYVRVSPLDVKSSYTDARDLISTMGRGLVRGARAKRSTPRVVISKSKPKRSSS